jgi:hypothetical protein
MRDHERGNSRRLQAFAQVRAESRARRGVKGGQRLVEEKESRLGRHRSRKSNALQLTARELARISTRDALQIEQLQHCVRFVRAGCTIQTPQPVFDVPGYGEVREHGIVLRQIADMPLLRWQTDAAFGVEPCPVSIANVTGIRLVQAGETPEDCALA